MMKPWQTPFNKAPNKGREREKKGQEGLVKRAKKKPPHTAQWVTKEQRKIILYSFT
jgi:hypothetical protein